MPIELWNETLHLAFDNPKLSDPTLKLAEFDYEDRTIDGSIEIFQKYELYVDTILNASEEILDVSPTKEWDVAVRIPAQAASRLSPVAILPEFRLSRAIRTPPFQAFLTMRWTTPYKVRRRRSSPGSKLQRRG